jgi:hypothetical protein
MSLAGPSSGPAAHRYRLNPTPAPSIIIEIVFLYVRGGKMKSIRLLIVLASFVGLSSTAHAGFLIDPYLGYAVSGGWSDNDGTPPQDGDGTTLSLGARLGWQTMMGLQLGLDVERAQSTLNDIANGGTADADTTALAYGPFIGFQSMMGVRAYFSYYLSSNSEVDDSNPGQTFIGSGFKLGLGYRIIEYFTVNLEYTSLSYDEVEVGGITFNEDFTADFISLAVSFPIHLL